MAASSSSLLGQVRHATCALLLLVVHALDAVAAATEAAAAEGAVVVCPRPTAEPGGVLSGSHKHHKEKVCPDFKDKPTQTFCCPSAITPGSFYCCSSEDVQRLKDIETARAWKEFIRNYLVVIVAACLALLCLSLFLLTLICRRWRGCPLYASGTTRAGLPSTSPQAASMYRPVETIPPKLYEAPPPYERAVNDWNCVIENEVNASRPQFIPPPLAFSPPST